MTWVALHVSGDWHVAGNTLVAGALRAVMAVANRIDERSFGKLGAPACVAVHAELIAGGDGFSRVRIVAIRATDAGVMHPAGEK